MQTLKQQRRMIRNPYMGQSPYHPYFTNPYNQSNYSQQMYHQPYLNANGKYSYPHNVQQPFLYQQNQNHGYQPFQIPYPNQKVKVPQAPAGGLQSIMSQFKSKDGGYDVNKMMNTAGQMMSTVNQIGGMVKQVGAMFKTKV